MKTLGDMREAFGKMVRTRGTTKLNAVVPATSALSSKLFGSEAELGSLQEQYMAMFDRGGGEGWRR